MCWLLIICVDIQLCILEVEWKWCARNNGNYMHITWWKIYHFNNLVEQSSRNCHCKYGFCVDSLSSCNTNMVNTVRISDEEYIKCHKILKPINVSENTNQRRQHARKWAELGNSIPLKRQKSWKLIDGEVDGINWASNEGCGIWFKRLLTIGNIVMIIASICTLITASYLCFSR